MSFWECDNFDTNNMNNRYDVQLEDKNLAEVSEHPSSTFKKNSIVDQKLNNKIFKQFFRKIEDKIWIN